MQPADDFSAIEALDLDPIKVKLMHPQAGKGWSRERADAVEHEYRRFLYLMKKFPNEGTAPLVDVDEFWHFHILDTKKYAADCQRVFGYFLHHFPYLGMRGEEDEKALTRMGERMRAIYEKTFGEAYARNIASVGEGSCTALSSAVRLNTAYGTPAAQPAFCYAPGVKPAFCYAPGVKAAFCYATAAEAFCYAPPDRLDGTECSAGAAQSTVQDTAFSYTETQQAAELNISRAPEERVGFYLERPRLPAV